MDDLKKQLLIWLHLRDKFCMWFLNERLLETIIPRSFTDLRDVLYLMMSSNIQPLIYIFYMLEMCYWRRLSCLFLNNYKFSWDLFAIEYCQSWLICQQVKLYLMIYSLLICDLSVHLIIYWINTFLINVAVIELWTYASLENIIKHIHMFILLRYFMTIIIIIRASLKLN